MTLLLPFVAVLLGVWAVLLATGAWRFVTVQFTTAVVATFAVELLERIAP